MIFNNKIKERAYKEVRKGGKKGLPPMLVSTDPKVKMAEMICRTCDIGEV